MNSRIVIYSLYLNASRRGTVIAHRSGILCQPMALNNLGHISSFVLPFDDFDSRLSCSYMPGHRISNIRQPYQRSNYTIRYVVGSSSVGGEEQSQTTIDHAQCDKNATDPDVQQRYYGFAVVTLEKDVVHIAKGRLTRRQGKDEKTYHGVVRADGLRKCQCIALIRTAACVHCASSWSSRCPCRRRR